MANGSWREVIIATISGKELSSAYYFDQPSVYNPYANKVIQYPRKQHDYYA